MKCTWVMLIVLSALVSCAGRDPVSTVDPEPLAADADLFYENYPVADIFDGDFIEPRPDRAAMTPPGYAEFVDELRTCLKGIPGGRMERLDEGPGGVIYVHASLETHDQIMQILERYSGDRSRRPESWKCYRVRLSVGATREMGLEPGFGLRPVRKDDQPHLAHRPADVVEMRTRLGQRSFVRFDWEGSEARPQGPGGYVTLWGTLKPGSTESGVNARTFHWTVARHLRVNERPDGTCDWESGPLLTGAVPLSESIIEGVWHPDGTLTALILQVGNPRRELFNE